MYRAQLAGQRVLVVLDDAADEAQVRPLLPGSAGCAVLVTSRSRLAALAGAHGVSLGALPPDQAAGLLAAIIGADRAAGRAGSGGGDRPAVRLPPARAPHRRGAAGVAAGVDDLLVRGAAGERAGGWTC